MKEWILAFRPRNLSRILNGSLPLLIYNISSNTKSSATSDPTIKRPIFLPVVLEAPKKSRIFANNETRPSHAVYPGQGYIPFPLKFNRTHPLPLLVFRDIVLSFNTAEQHVDRERIKEMSEALRWFLIQNVDVFYRFNKTFGRALPDDHLSISFLKKFLHFLAKLPCNMTETFPHNQSTAAVAKIYELYSNGSLPGIKIVIEKVKELVRNEKQAANQKILLNFVEMLQEIIDIHSKYNNSFSIFLKVEKLIVQYRKRNLIELRRVLKSNGTMSLVEILRHILSLDSQAMPDRNKPVQIGCIAKQIMKFMNEINKLVFHKNPGFGQVLRSFVNSTCGNGLHISNVNDSKGSAIDKDTIAKKILAAVDRLPIKIALESGTFIGIKQKVIEYALNELKKFKFITQSERMDHILRFLDAFSVKNFSSNSTSALSDQRKYEILDLYLNKYVGNASSIHSGNYFGRDRAILCKVSRFFLNFAGNLPSFDANWNQLANMTDGFKEGPKPKNGSAIGNMTGKNSSFVHSLLSHLFTEYHSVLLKFVKKTATDINPQQKCRIGMCLRVLGNLSAEILKNRSDSSMNATDNYSWILKSFELSKEKNFTNGMMWNNTLYNVTDAVGMHCNESGNVNSTHPRIRAKDCMRSAVNILLHLNPRLLVNAPGNSSRNFFWDVTRILVTQSDDFLKVLNELRNRVKRALQYSSTFMDQGSHESSESVQVNSYSDVIAGALLPQPTGRNSTNSVLGLPVYFIGPSLVPPPYGYSKNENTSHLVLGLLWINPGPKFNLTKFTLEFNHPKWRLNSTMANNGTEENKNDKINFNVG